MVEKVHRWTRIHKILCSSLSTTKHRMTLKKSLMTKLSRTTHSYYANTSSVSMLDGRDIDTTVYKKSIETDCICTLIITAADPNGRYAYRKLL